MKKQYTIVSRAWCFVSAERARPYLLTTDAHASTDYINAVYIDVRINVLVVKWIKVKAASSI